jgi:hypothetical protein
MRSAALAKSSPCGIVQMKAPVELGLRAASRIGIDLVWNFWLRGRVPIGAGWAPARAGIGIKGQSYRAEVGSVPVRF